METCPDELLLFFHHVPYTHVLHSGSTVIQHLYDTHADGYDEVVRMAAAWASLAGRVPRRVLRPGHASGSSSRSAAPASGATSSARAFFRRSGIPDATGRTIY